MRHRVQHRFTFAFLVLLAVIAGDAGTCLHAGQTYSVSPEGDDNGPGTVASPFKTLARAMRALSAGDTLLVRGGVYVESLAITSSNGYASGTASAPITVRAHPGETPVLRAEPVGDRVALRIGPDLAMGHWELEGITVGGASTRTGILLSAVRSVRISRCRWEETLDDGSRGIVISDGSRDIHVTGCRFDRPMAAPIVIEGESRAVVRDNEITGSGGEPDIVSRGNRERENRLSYEQGPRMRVVAPDVVDPGERAIVEIRVEMVRGAAHFPLRIAFDSEILELEEVSPGGFAGSDGSSTLFLAEEDRSPGIVNLAISRVPPAAGISGDGVLCRLTFRAVAPGETGIITRGSAMLDAEARRIEFRGENAHVSVR